MEYTKDEKSIIWLDSFNDFDYKHKIELLDQVASPYEIVKNFSKHKNFIEKSVGEKLFYEMKNSLKDGSYIDKVLSNLEKKKIEVVTKYSNKYPPELLKIPAPPLLLYCKGNLELLEKKKFSIVGSRKTLAFVEKQTMEFSSEISKHFVVVTGLAEGGDSCAINGALESENLISVLAYGYDYIYPECNKSLLEKIIQKGLVITEHNPTISPKRHLFIVRNRIIAGLGQGVLVVSAGQKSGAKVTAEYALEYGKDVFAFPYNIGVYSGVGCNEIIKNGGRLCNDIVDIFGTYGINLFKQEVISMSNDESLIYNIIKDGEVHIQEIENKSGLKQSVIASIISLLEIKGLVSRTGGNKYCAIK